MVVTMSDMYPPRYGAHAAFEKACILGYTQVATEIYRRFTDQINGDIEPPSLSIAIVRAGHTQTFHWFLNTFETKITLQEFRVMRAEAVAGGHIDIVSVCDQCLHI